jgi:hypothetical protein
VKTGHELVANTAAGWALIFAALHIVWASGWYVGLDAAQARVAFAKPWFFAYDVVAACMCIVAVPVSLALGHPRAERLPRRFVLTLAWIGTTLLVLRAVGSLGQGVYEVWMGRFTLQRMGIWEPWFYAGAALFSANLWLYRRRTRSGAA